MASKSEQSAQGQTATPILSYEGFQRMQNVQQYAYQNFYRMTNPWIDQTEDEKQLQYEQYLKLQSSPHPKPLAVAQSEETEPSTEVVVSKGGVCCQSHLGGCDAAHGAIHYAETQHQQYGDTMFIPIAEDTQSSENWIPPALVKKYGFAIEKLSRVQNFDTITGATLQASHSVTLPLCGKSMPRTRQIRFLVAPSTTPRKHLLAGKPFIREYGHVWYLFVDRPKGEVDIICESDVKEDEKAEMADLKAKADAQAAALKAKREQKRKTESSSRSNGQQASSSSGGGRSENRQRP